MKAPAPRSAVLGQFVGTILMSVALGMLLGNTFDQWLRGQSFIFWLALSVLFIAAIGTNAIAVTRRIT